MDTNRFIKEEDYSIALRQEIKNTLLEGYSDVKLFTAEDMAIAQVKSYIGGRYDVKDIFIKRGDKRNSFIIMMVIDCAVYHLYRGEHYTNEEVKQRYNDAITWMEKVGDGRIKADLPLLKNDEGNLKSEFIIRSKELNNHKF